MEFSCVFFHSDAVVIVIVIVVQNSKQIYYTSFRSRHSTAQHSTAHQMCSVRLHLFGQQARTRHREPTKTHMPAKSATIIKSAMYARCHPVGRPVFVSFRALLGTRKATTRAPMSTAPTKICAHFAPGYSFRSGGGVPVAFSTSEPSSETISKLSTRVTFSSCSFRLPAPSVATSSVVSPTAGGVVIATPGDIFGSGIKNFCRDGFGHAGKRDRHARALHD